MRLRLVATVAKVAGIALGPRGVTSYGRLVPGARYSVEDEEGHVVENVSQVDLELPRWDGDNELWAEVRIRVPIEVRSEFPETPPTRRS